MTVFGKILRISRPFRTVASSKTRNPSPRNISDPRLLCHRSGCFDLQNTADASEIQWLKCRAQRMGSSFVLPALLATLLGVNGLQTATADADQSTGWPLPSEPHTSYEELEEIAKKERLQIEGSLKSKGLRAGSYPRFMIGIKGEKVTLKFRIPPGCEVPRVIASLVSHLGLKVEQRNNGGSGMFLRAWDSAVSWQLTLTRPDKQKETWNEEDEDLCILLFGSLVTADRAELEFIKRGSLSEEERDAFVSVLELAARSLKEYNVSEKKEASTDKSVSTLESMGVRVYGLDEPSVYSSNSEMSWENIAGYHQQKRDIEDTILLALQSPEVYDNIARGTRQKFETNRPRAVLFEGPPGTGKTSSARVIANQAGVPLLYVPLEVVMSKYYGESERLLAKVFSLANEFPDGAIIFLDEVDSFAVARDGEMHEATRRVLSVLLRQIDGFEQDKKVVVIAATNRKQDLDPALISRFDSIIMFDLPDQQTRHEIAAQYAKHLTDSDLDELAAVTEEMSGRDIRDVCQQAERSWASKIIRGQVCVDGEQSVLPPINEYTESAVNRRKGMSIISDARIPGLDMASPKKSRLLLD